ncbi:NAD-dependent epimerase/dehydratase family protein [Patescibacteria group bacterium]|nr:NAD-dependent epimerase/dehydratase family protein [Patescibacteria group bacterium]MBU1931203.1 NAD-dependent epimerase/dehydratase family protein [Patescibacteria group bacterium]
MKILVTGGAGFIGSQVVDAFIESGHEVIVFDDLSTGSKDNLNPRAKFYEVDITSPEAVELVQKEQPAVLNHHAAQMDVRRSVADPAFDAHTNTLGLINLMEAFKKTGSAKKVIFASTGGAVYGEAKTIPTPEDYPAQPLSPYGISKLTSEHYLYYYHQVFNIPFVCLRYANVYGPRQNPHGEAGVVAIFCQKMLKQKQTVINGSGEQTRDFIYVADIVKANLVALNKNNSGIFNIGTAKETSINTIFRVLNNLTGSKTPENHGPAKDGEQQRSCLDWQKAKQELNWQPEVELAAGLAKTAEFFKSKIKPA